MKLGRTVKSIFAAGVLALGVTLSASVSFAQGCALCYNDAASTGSRGILALRHGILVLLFPPMFIFSGIFGMLYSRRNTHHELSAHMPAPGPANVSAPSEFRLHLE